jgi:hypothetical protein
VAIRTASWELDANAKSHATKHSAATQTVSDRNSMRDNPRQVPQKEWTAPGVVNKQPLNVKTTAMLANGMLSTRKSLRHRGISPARRDAGESTSPERGEVAIGWLRRFLVFLLDREVLNYLPGQASGEALGPGIQHIDHDFPCISRAVLFPIDLPLRAWSR